MKVSFTTLSCPDWTWSKITNEAARLGYDGIEVRGADGEMYLPKAKPFLPENIKGTMNDLKNKGLEITNLGTSCCFHDPSSFDTYIAEGKDYIDLAHTLGVPYIRVFGNNVPDPAEKEALLERVAAGIKELCSYCEGKNVAVLFETHGDFSDLSHLLPVLEKVGSRKLGVLWDIEHTYKHYGEDIGDFYEKVKDYIKHTHIKDTKRIDGSFQLCRVGEGDIPIIKYINMLEKTGFQGYLSLEWEKKWIPALEDPEYVIPEYIEYIKKHILEITKT